MENHINYIHFNPVKHGYVDDPFQWELSSIAKFAENHGNLQDLVKKTEYDLKEYDV